MPTTYQLQALKVSGTLSVKRREMLLQTYYSAIFQDVNLTHNINIHSHYCLAVCPVGALATIFTDRPEFARRPLNKITRVPFLEYLKP